MKRNIIGEKFWNNKWDVGKGNINVKIFAGKIFSFVKGLVVRLIHCSEMRILSTEMNICDFVVMINPFIHILSVPTEDRKLLLRIICVWIDDILTLKQSCCLSNILELQHWNWNLTRKLKTDRLKCYLFYKELVQLKT